MAAEATVGPPAVMKMNRLGGLTRELISHDSWSRADLEAHQRRRLRAVVQHAVAHSPYYRETLGGRAADRALHQLPVLSKATLMAHFDQVVCDHRLRRGDLEAHLAGPDPADSYLGEYRVLTTSGTTGLRGIFVLSEDEALTWIAAGIRGAAAIGITPQTRMVGIGAPGTLHVTRQLYAPLSPGGSDVPELTVLTPLPEIVAALNAYQPEVLIGYPSVAGRLADEQLAGRLRIHPRAGFYGAERLTPGIRDRIRQAWGFEPHSVHAATEVPTIAFGTLDGGLEIAEDVVLVEVVDEHDRAVPPGTPGAKVLVTNLVNLAQPLIRYELSDAVTLASDTPPPGRPYRRIASVDGRTRDTLLLPGAEGNQVAIHPSAFSAVFLHVPAVQRYQLVHDERGLHARVVLPAGVDEDDAAGVLDRLRRSLGDTVRTAGAVLPPLDVTEVADLEREPGIGAKAKLVQSRFSPS